jgi:hypothetical protein
MNVQGEHKTSRKIKQTKYYWPVTQIIPLLCINFGNSTWNLINIYKNIIGPFITTNSIYLPSASISTWKVKPRA